MMDDDVPGFRAQPSYDSVHVRVVRPPLSNEKDIFCVCDFDQPIVQVGWPLSRPKLPSGASFHGVIRAASLQMLTFGAYFRARHHRTPQHHRSD